MDRKPYTVWVDDNFHWGDEEERYKEGEYETREEALAVARRIVDREIGSQVDITQRRSYLQLYDQYTWFGEDPWISGPVGGGFSAREYAERRAKEVFREMYRALPVPRVFIEKGRLFCPHCGVRLHCWRREGDDGVRICPHVVFSFYWENRGGEFRDMFMSARADFAPAFLDSLRRSPYHTFFIERNGHDPLDAVTEARFISGDFATGDEVSSRIGSLCHGSPTDMFPSLFGPETVVYTDERIHAGVYFAIDAGAGREATPPDEPGQGADGL